MNGELEAFVPLIPRDDVSGARPIDLLASEIHLGGDGEIRAGRRGAGGDLDGWRLTAFHAKTADDVHADHWEMHPEADEIVSCVVGKIRLFLRLDGRGEEVVRLGAGTAAIVPRGRWHRIELDIPSTILALTLPRGTRRERRTGPEQRHGSDRPTGSHLRTGAQQRIGIGQGAGAERQTGSEPRAGAERAGAERAGLVASKPPGRARYRRPA